MKNKYDFHSHDTKIITTSKAYFEESINTPHKTFIIDSSPWPSGMYYGIFTSQAGKVKIIPFMVYH